MKFEKIYSPKHFLKIMLPPLDNPITKWTLSVGLRFGILIYLFSMFLYPFMAGDWNWKHVQQVWHDWQSLNVGVLALTSSVIFFRATKYYTEDQRKRDFRAAQAFLPSALSELTTYFRSCSQALSEAWGSVVNDVGDQDGGGVRPTLLNPVAPELPSSYKDVFAHCIKYAQPEIGNSLAALLSELQVHHARFSDLRPGQEIRPSVIRVHIRASLMTYMLNIGLLQARVNRLFPFARNEKPFNDNPLNWNELENAYQNLALHFENYGHATLGSLEATSRQWIDQHEDEPF